MKSKVSRIFFPALVLLCTAAGAFGLENRILRPSYECSPAQSRDTVIYLPDAYRKLSSGTQAAAADSLVDDTPEVQDSSEGRRLSPRDSLKQLLDTSLWDKLDSIYLADSAARAKEKFEQWYASLSPQERKSYDQEQKAKIKMARADSLAKVKERNKEIRDSIVESTPRILESYFLPDSMHYKRTIVWTTDPRFHKMDVSIPDSGYNYHFNDYRFRREDVNATWLGVAGSPVQYYDYFKRGSKEDVEFYTAQEAWSYSSATLPHYNTKTPYTELCYTGTLLAKQTKESDNIHLFTTQNITPELNFSLEYNHFGGGGMLEKEETKNNSFVAQTNYLGKNYLMHAAYIRNVVTRQENGGLIEEKWIRDTVVDTRDIAVHLKNASSEIKKNSFIVEQQLRIPFNFINKIKARRDSTFTYDADSLNRDITSAFIGHSSEFSSYGRKYNDKISDQAGKDFYNNVFNYNPASSNDSLGVKRLDNKVFLRLQPWASDAIVSKLDVGLGDRLETYFDSTSLRPTKHRENSVYAYAGAQGQLRQNFFWDAGAELFLLGAKAGDFSIDANASLVFYPFRRARKSPLSLDFQFNTSLKEPTYYQKVMNTNHFKWENDFSKSSSTTIQAGLNIPRWKFEAKAGYALLTDPLYYGGDGIIAQSPEVISVINASLRKEFVFGPLHLDNRVLLQYSSAPEVVPVPPLAANLRYFVQFNVKKDIMQMQLGVDALWNSSWYSPAWNPALGVFHNQSERLYNNGPYFDLFLNIQWKRACIFLKFQNAGLGWPMDRADYFSADRYILTTRGMDGLKIGIWWPFSAEPRGQAR